MASCSPFFRHRKYRNWLWLYNNEIACPTNTTTGNFLLAHPDYSKSTEPHLNDSITVATIWVRLPQGDVLFKDNIPSSFQLNFLCNPSVKSPFDKCPVGNCFVLSTTDDQREGDDSIAFRCFQDIWYKIKCRDRYRGPYQEI
ncbi:Hypothetical predicted protein [Octopus vulgaris]|uniref:Uncharacterized protein n=1 Tax=Octopus vulgaris TaxID=6645 RepID=A0AA36FE41_OCTVU|nr:Hypothetical predicted protein [Octopus vulgaris]